MLNKHPSPLDCITQHSDTAQSILVLTLHNISSCPTTTDRPPQDTGSLKLLRWTGTPSGPPTTLPPTRGLRSISTEVGSRQSSCPSYLTFQDTRMISTCWSSSEKPPSSSSSSSPWWPSST